MQAQIFSVMFTSLSFTPATFDALKLPEMRKYDITQQGGHNRWPNFSGYPLMRIGLLFAKGLTLKYEKDYVLYHSIKAPFK